MRAGITAAVLIAVSTPFACAQKIVGGPMVVNVGPRSATVVWVVQDDEVTLHGPAATVRSSPSLSIGKTNLTGLKANTRYEYDVAHNGARGSFKTPPAGAEPYNFVVFGDTRTRNDVHRRVIETLIKRGVPDFVLHTGDMVADGNDTSLWPTFFEIEKDLLGQAAFFPSLGNHERNTRYFGELFLKETPFYSFDWGNGHFTVINSDIANAGGSQRAKDAFWAEQTQWLEDDLASHQDSAYRFVMAHHPPFTAVARRQGDNAQMTALVPMFEKYRVTAAFFGHDHNYQHYLKNGIHYVTTGGGGAPLYDVDKPPAGITKVAVSVENFVKVSVDGASVHVEAIALDGTSLDHFDLTGEPTAASR